MKVRLHQDSIRIRLTQGEVASLGEGLGVRSETHFLQGSLEVQVHPEGEAFGLTFEHNRIRLYVPFESAREWSGNDVEGLYASSGPCQIALEKDYACLHKTGDANVGTFPNPTVL